MNNEIYIRRLQKVYLKADKHLQDDAKVISIIADIEKTGYMFTTDVINVMKTLSDENLNSFNHFLRCNIKTVLGIKNYKPMYPNFPKQVMEADEMELFVNALFHYLGDIFGTRILPDYEKEDREEFKDKTKYRMIGLGTVEEFENIFKNLVSSKTSLSVTDYNDVDWFIKEYGDSISDILPNEIPMKEILTYIAGKFEGTSMSENFLKRYIRTGTDVLRYAVSLSGGDVSLAINTKFNKFNRKTRKVLLGLLENARNLTDDMLKYKNAFKRLGEILHPFEYKKRFPKTSEAFDVIRNNRYYLTYNGKVEEYLKDKNISELLLALRTNPGDFARRLDDVLTKFPKNVTKIIDAFKQVSDFVSSPVLLQVMTHFKYHDTIRGNDIRTFFPKGNVAKVKAIVQNKKALSKNVRKNVVNVCKDSLLKNYSKLESLGNVYLGKDMKNYNVPFAMRSTQKSLKTIVRGSRISLENKNTVRFFIYWKDISSDSYNDRVDIDLSAVFLDKNFSNSQAIAYTNLREGFSCHSGDITSAPRGASEFIDVDIKKALKVGHRYIVMNVNSYSGQKFIEMPECFAGFMMRDGVQVGEIYEPKSVINKFDLTSDMKYSIPLIIDMKDLVVVWADIALKGSMEYWGNNVINNMTSIGVLTNSMVNLIKPNLYDLLKLHISARGNEVKVKKDADLVFDVASGNLTPFDLDEIRSKYL